MQNTFDWCKFDTYLKVVEMFHILLIKPTTDVPFGVPNTYSVFVSNIILVLGQFN